jgi:hypothetical protein
VRVSTLENARDRELAVLKDCDETIERVQRQLGDGSRRAAADIAELRQARECTMPECAYKCLEMLILFRLDR